MTVTLRNDETIECNEISITSMSNVLFIVNETVIKTCHITEVSHIENPKEHNEYYIKDDVWPSRRWNADRTDYIDLSD